MHQNNLIFSVVRVRKNETDAVRPLHPAGNVGADMDGWTLDARRAGHDAFQEIA